MPVNMEDRDGQHMGVVTKALVKVVPPSSMILRVLFITCREPATQDVMIIVSDESIFQLFSELQITANNQNSVVNKPDGHSAPAYGALINISLWRKKLTNH